TASLQTVATANRFATPPRTHVFGITSDPYGAGVGVSRENHLDHPRYMTGLGSLPPIDDAFDLLKQMRPDVKRVGLVWNPTEANSVAATNLGRSAAKRIGVELVEATAENATSAGESAASVLSRGIDALWVSPDVTVVTAVDVILAHAKRARVPVFTSLPGHAEKGALFDLGADYPGIGKAEGQLAADILDGTDPATIPVENLMPVELHVNRLALDGVQGRWNIPAAALDRAVLVIDAAGRHDKRQAAASTASNDTPALKPLSRRMTVDLIEYADTPNAELARKGLMAGFEEAALVPGKDFELRRQSAQGDMATLSSIIDAALTRRTDLMLTMSTPSLQNALLRARGTPIVFGLVSNPFIVDAGKTDSDHLPYVTGSYLDQPVNELLTVLRQVMPAARRIGTLFTPAEINSVYCKEQLEKAAKKAGLEFEAVAINSSTEVTEAAATIAGRDLDVLTQVTDNLIASSFPAVMEAARRARLPVVTYAPAVADMGPLLIVARDYYDNGVETAKIAARVLRGERTADIPFSPVPKINYIVNLKVAGDYHIRIPPDLVAKATRVIR
ncbi:MAG: ABC transporter substrate-binding protein, partial [Vicinamibacterales bacterium]